MWPSLTTLLTLTGFVPWTVPSTDSATKSRNLIIDENLLVSMPPSGFWARFDEVNKVARVFFSGHTAGVDENPLTHNPYHQIPE